VFNNRALRIFCRKGMKWYEAGEDCIMRCLISCSPHQILLGGLHQRRGSRDSVVGIATSYGLDDRVVGVRILVG
jgi:hypothetical protein